MLKRDVYLEERKNGMSVAEIAEKYGVQKNTIYSAGKVSEVVKSPICPPDMLDDRRFNRDCLMFREDGKKVWCSGLKGVYCGIEECKFYKPMEGKK